VGQHAAISGTPCGKKRGALPGVSTRCYRRFDVNDLIVLTDDSLPALLF
jgi:hypothetical protein